MKKMIAMGLCLILALSLVGCGSKSVPDKPFETDNISKISFKEGPNDWVEVPTEELPEYVEWLESFRIGEKADRTLAPGSNSVKIKIEYSDGTLIENGLSTFKIGNNNYYLTYNNVPDTYLKWQFFER